MPLPGSLPRLPTRRNLPRVGVPWCSKHMAVHSGTCAEDYSKGSPTRDQLRAVDQPGLTSVDSGGHMNEWMNERAKDNLTVPKQTLLMQLRELRSKG